ncbi:CDP-alcohol phosphatidyltransferase family protein [Cecembia sp.]|uniref:CDP-alcohol phosphatidyltransferase family protein n=1 Tax=Cecembia sp. TaxID=1898110 RepID=UPI0025BE792D|nr:CDP-alcohol phosphatidyltransferase family protein [Cecembia sp.]
MPKLSSDDKFLDVSDYGRPFARTFVSRIQYTDITPVQVTFLFGISGLIAVYCILNGLYLTAGLFLIIKSILDAADWELARVKNRPSYTGRYLDSIFDIFLNLLVFGAVWYVTDTSLLLAALAFLSVQLQGTLYNYYYVILRHNTEGGEKTSKIMENERPNAFPVESQRTVDFLYDTYNVLYIAFDKLIYYLDQDASDAPIFPKWFMTLISIYGLGFQLLIISFMLSTGLTGFIIYFFIGYNVFLLIFIGIRKAFLR